MAGFVNGLTSIGMTIAVMLLSAGLMGAGDNTMSMSLFLVGLLLGAPSLLFFLVSQEMIDYPNGKPRG